MKIRTHHTSHTCSRVARSRLWLIAGLVLLLVAIAAPVSAQFYFGKNKVQYTRFDWQVMTTDHFRIYFYQEEKEVARIAADIAEKSYHELAARFNHEVRRKVPLIIYSSPSYFSQTNVIPGILPESVGGFTEFMKGRVVLPFHGSYHDFVHVLRHELVHVFQLSRLEEVTSHLVNQKIAYPPLWFTEGQAEFWSKDWDTEADMIVKDMVISGHLLSINDFYQVEGSFFMYKLGESVCSFIDSTYGPEKIAQMYDNWAKGRTFEDIVKITLGDDLNELSRKWEYALKKRYFPEIQQLGLPNMAAKQISFEGFSVKGVPIRWKDGDSLKTWIVYKANRRGYTGIYMKELNDRHGPVKSLIDGDRSSRFESLYLLRSGIDANDSGQIVFSSKSKERDVIYLYSLKEGKVVHEYQFPDLVSSRSPQLSPDGRQVVFSGVKKGGQSDLYVLDLSTGTYQAATNDIYYDTDPVFSNDGLNIVFSSDRGSGGKRRAMNLFRCDLTGRQMQQLTFGQNLDQSPTCTANGIYFSSDRLGSFNLFLLDTAGVLTRQSTFVTAALDPRATPDGKHLLFTGYQNEAFQVFQMDLTKTPETIAQVPSFDSANWVPDVIDNKIADASINYDAEYSFDIAQSNISYDPIYGSVGGVQAAISDMLGNRAFYFLLANTAQSNDEILSSFNVGVTYINKGRRMNWGVGAFHLYDEYFNDYDQYYYERQAGVVGLFSYPVSKFQRVDFTSYARYTKKDLLYGRRPREGFLFSNYVSFIFDNSLWDVSGPIQGRRYNVTVGVTHALDKARAYNRLVSVDLRHYFRIGMYSAFANRLWAFSSTGIEPQRVYLGGSWSFRGFSRRAFYNRNILFTSNELRFPLINNLLLGLPVGALGFQNIRGALFYDTGSAWDDEFDQFYGSFGAGFRVNLGYFVLLRFDFSRTTDYHTISRDTRFDFFFGWNF
jgi:hypothetical protein